MSIILCTQHKGGAGKTALAVHLAGFLATQLGGYCPNEVQSFSGFPPIAEMTGLFVLDNYQKCYIIANLSLLVMSYYFL